MFRSRFSDAERIEIVEMDLKGEPVSLMTNKFKCSEHSIYQVRRSSWYQLLSSALSKHMGDSRDITRVMAENNQPITGPEISVT